MNDEGYGESTYSRKRSYATTDEDKDENDRENKRRNSNSGPEPIPLVKVLIPNYAAGAIIGKGGANISDLQNRFGAKIRLSPSGEFYPGTEERIVILSGEVNQIIDLNNYIIDKVHLDSSDVRLRDEERGQQVKLVVPNTTAGLVIGRAGATIKAMHEETKAKIMISSRDESKVPGERIITITGNEEQRMEAARQIISKIAADKENMNNNKNLTYSQLNPLKNGSGTTTFGGSFGGSSGVDLSGANMPGGLSALNSMIGNLQQHNNQNSQALLAALSKNPLAALQQSGLASQLGLGGGGAANPFSSLTGSAGLSGNLMGNSITNSIKTTVTINMEIPDILVGAILGKQGKTVHEFIHFSGAKIQFSGKNDFAPGTTDRILTIQGDLNQTQTAYFLINQKIMQAETELGSGSQRR